MQSNKVSLSSLNTIPVVWKFVSKNENEAIFNVQQTQEEPTEWKFNISYKLSLINADG
jgi:hypothetical protein